MITIEMVGSVFTVDAAQVEFVRAVSRRADQLLRDSKGTWRKGQCLFNALHYLDPELADIIRASPCDPFYLDSRIPAFWKELLGESI